MSAGRGAGKKEVGDILKLGATSLATGRAGGTLRGSRLTVFRVDDLEVLDRGLGDAAVEVEHVGLGLLVPARGFVHQGHQFVCVVVCLASQQRLEFLR